MKKIFITKDEILQRHTNGETLTLIAKEQGVSRQRIAQIAQLGRKRKTVFLDREELKELYVHQKLSTTDIAALKGCSPSSVLKYLGYYHILITKTLLGPSIRRVSNFGFFSFEGKGYQFYNPRRLKLVKVKKNLDILEIFGLDGKFVGKRKLLQGKRSQKRIEKFKEQLISQEGKKIEI